MFDNIQTVFLNTKVRPVCVWLLSVVGKIGIDKLQKTIKPLANKV